MLGLWVYNRPAPPGLVFWLHGYPQCSHQWWKWNLPLHLTRCIWWNHLLYQHQSEAGEKFTWDEINLEECQQYGDMQMSVTNVRWLHERDFIVLEKASQVLIVYRSKNVTIWYSVFEQVDFFLKIVSFLNLSTAYS